QSDTWFDGIKLLAVKDGPLDQLRDTLKQLIDKLKPKKGLQGVARNIIWTLDKDYCEDLLRQIDRAKSTIGLALQGDTLYASPGLQDETQAYIRSYSKLAQAIKADTAAIGGIDQRVATISQRLENLHSQENSSDTELKQKSVRKFSNGFLHSISSRPSRICSKGESTAPDSGSLIHQLSKLGYLDHIKRYVVPEFFKERETQTPENLLAGACVQLAQQSSGPLPRALVDVHESHSKLRTRPNCAEVLKILDEVVHDFNTVYLVIDALDESSEQNRNTLLKQTKALSGNIRLLVTTRHVDDIVNRFRNCPRIEIRATDADLTKYISSRVSTENRLGRILRDHPPLENQLCKRVTAKADGMFLAAKFHMDALSSRGSLKSLREALKTLPTTLDELYNDALHRIEVQSPDDRQLAFKALRWVAYTYRPLGFRALQEALAIEPGEEDFDGDGLYPTGLVVDVCAGLLTADAETGKVRLVHYTTQDYMDSVLASKFPDAHALIAEDCISYLDYQILQSIGPDEQIPLASGLFAYASTFWASHTMARRIPRLNTLIERFLASGPSVHLMNIRDYDQYLRSGYIRRMSRLCRCDGYGIAAFLGLCDELTTSLLHVGNINKLLNGRYYRWDGGVRSSALHLAVCNHQIETVCILLDHGADIERKDSRGNTPLHIAIECGALETVRTLVQRGADIMAKDSSLRIPFQNVWWSSPLPFLQYLVDAGTVLERRHLFENSSLMHSITSSNDREAIQWVFGAALKDSDRSLLPSTMLDNAAWKGAKYMVDTLLIFGADVNRRDSNGETALHQAVESDQVEILESLIAHHADINVQTRFGVTPLMNAIDSDCTSSALFLLEHGAITGFADVNGITALHLASARGNKSLVKGLMDKNESVEKRSNLNLAAFWPAEEPWMEVYAACIALLDVKDYHDYRISVFAVRGSKALSDLREDLMFRQIEKHCLKWRLWDQGMTAFDIALLRDDKQTLKVLSSGEKREDQSYDKNRDEYFCEGFSAVTFQELMTEFERRDSEDYGLQER
ncbi:MAG: hypothetical protein Q9180_004290, partial [Flavoplaca navasiana]